MKFIVENDLRRHYKNLFCLARQAGDEGLQGQVERHLTGLGRLIDGQQAPVDEFEIRQVETPGLPAQFRATNGGWRNSEATRSAPPPSSSTSRVCNSRRNWRTTMPNRERHLAPPVVCSGCAGLGGIPIGHGIHQAEDVHLPTQGDQHFHLFGFHSAGIIDVSSSFSISCSGSRYRCLCRRPGRQGSRGKLSLQALRLFADPAGHLPGRGDKSRIIPRPLDLPTHSTSQCPMFNVSHPASPRFAFLVVFHHQHQGSGVRQRIQQVAESGCGPGRWWRAPAGWLNHQSALGQEGHGQVAVRSSSLALRPSNRVRFRLTMERSPRPLHPFSACWMPWRSSPRRMMTTRYFFQLVGRGVIRCRVAIAF